MVQPFIRNHLDNGPELILGAFSDAFDMRRLEAMVRASVSGQRFRRL
jgi:hypothetical protein